MDRMDVYGLKEDGSLPDVIEFGEEQLGVPVALRSPYGYPLLRLSGLTKDSIDLTVNVVDHAAPRGNANDVSTPYWIVLRSDDIVPIFEEVYRVQTSDRRVQLERVTDSIPKQIGRAHV